MQKFDEMATRLPLAAMDGAAGWAGSDVRPTMRGLRNGWRARAPSPCRRRAEAEVIFRRVGITFAVYGAKDEDGVGTERLIPWT